MKKVKIKVTKRTHPLYGEILEGRRIGTGTVIIESGGKIKALYKGEYRIYSKIADVVISTLILLGLVYAAYCFIEYVEISLLAFVGSYFMGSTLIIFISVWLTFNKITK